MSSKMVRDGRVQEEPDAIAWSQWFRTADRVIMKTTVPIETTGGAGQGLDRVHR
jgi:hypothetical protein